MTKKELEQENAELRQALEDILACCKDYSLSYPYRVGWCQAKANWILDIDQEEDEL